MADYEPLTIESSAAIGAFIQELSIRAEGGKPVDEETLALRILAANHADPDYDFSTIRSLQSGDAPITASADGDDKFAKLTALMMGDTKSSADQVAAGQFPKPPPVVLMPDYTDKSIADNYASLMDATSMCQLYANLMQVQQKPEGFNITTEANAAFKFQAQMAYNAMQGPMAGFFVMSAANTQTYNDTIPKNEIHDHLLGKMFDGFGFDSATKNSLDNQLTNFVGGLSKIHADNSPQNSLDFMIRLNLVPKRNVSADEKDPIWIYQPTTYLLYMTINAKTFSQSTGKNSSVEKVDFKFQLTFTKCELNTRRFEASRDKFEEIFKLVTDKNLKAYSDLLNKQIKTTDSNLNGKK